jgi:ribonuclease Z
MVSKKAGGRASARRSARNGGAGQATPLRAGSSRAAAGTPVSRRAEGADPGNAAPPRPARGKVTDATSPTDRAAMQPPRTPPASIYGGGASAGITLPPYFKPTPSVASASNYFPLLEELGPEEMRISFMGTCPFPPKRNQAATCIMVELGNGDRFFFDFGPGCLRNIIAQQVPLQDVNDIFVTHLHVDHFGELPYLYCFAPWAGRWKPLRVYGPSGRTKHEGIAHMIAGMQEMTGWHTKSFNSAPIGEGYDVEVTEFDYEDDNGVCYDKNGVTVRHWRRSHNMDGASAYRLDWNGLSFVWTGDGRPDKLTAEYAAGVDVFVTELQPDLGKLMELKTGIPQQIYNLTIDAVHTDHYATGYVINQVNPRIGMVTHFAYDHELVNECIAGVREHWNGLFCFGAPDGVVVNVTTDAIWVRDAVLPDSAKARKPSTETELRQMFGGQIPETMRIPEPKFTRDDLLSPGVRAIEISPSEFEPADVYRPRSTSAQEAFGAAMGRDIPVELLIGAQGTGAAISEFTHAIRSMASALNLLGGGLGGRVLTDPAQKAAVQDALASLAETVKSLTRQSDDVRAAASAAVQGAAKSMQDPDKRGDLSAAAAALVEVLAAASGSLQNPAARTRAKNTAGQLLDTMAASLASSGVEDSSEDPVEALRAAFAEGPARAADLLGGRPKDSRAARKGQQAVRILGHMLLPAVDGDGQQPAITRGLKSLGQTLSSPQQRQAIKAAVNALIDGLSAAGPQLKKKDTQAAIKGSVDLLIDGIGQQLPAANGRAARTGQDGSTPLDLERVPIPIGRP